MSERAAGLQQRLGFVGHVLWCDAEFLEQLVCRGRGTETVHADEIGFVPFATLACQPAIPALTHCSFDTDAHGACGQNPAAICFVLLGEQFHTRHGDNPCAVTPLYESLLTGDHCFSVVSVVSGHDENQIGVLGIDVNVRNWARI